MHRVGKGQYIHTFISTFLYFTKLQQVAVKDWRTLRTAECGSLRLKLDRLQSISATMDSDWRDSSSESASFQAGLEWHQHVNVRLN